MAAVYLGGEARKLRMKWGRQTEGREESSQVPQHTQELKQAPGREGWQSIVTATLLGLREGRERCCTAKVARWWVKAVGESRHQQLCPRHRACQKEAALLRPWG